LSDGSKCSKRRLLELCCIAHPMIRWSLISSAASCISKKSSNDFVIRR
jgi:hypothetical protein